MSYDTLEPTLPRASYVEAAEFQREFLAMFKRGWMCVGRADAMPLVGDYLAMVVGDVSMLLVRAEDGRVVAHHNVCRHRGAELIPMPDGGVKSGRFGATITCPYHAWSYHLSGPLRGAPHLKIDCEALSLHPIETEIWAGFLFVRVDSALNDPLLHHLGEGVARISRYPLDKLKVGAQKTYEVAANWKVVLENYNECYHCGPIHPELCEIVPAFRQGGGQALDWDKGVPHRAGATTFTFSGETNRAPFPGLSETEKTHHKGELFYPNLMLSLAMDHVAAFYVWPMSATKTRIQCDFLFHPDEMSRDTFDPSDAVTFWDLVNQQDWSICESVQRGMTNTVFESGFYAPMEDYSLDLRRYVRERLAMSES